MSTTRAYLSSPVIDWLTVSRYNQRLSAQEILSYLDLFREQSRNYDLMIHNITHALQSFRVKANGLRSKKNRLDREA